MRRLLQSHKIERSIRQMLVNFTSVCYYNNRFEEAYNTNTDGQKGGPRNMCDVLDKVENRGESKVALLMKKLFDQNRIEDAKKASENEEYRIKLMKEFGIS